MKLFWAQLLGWWKAETATDFDRAQVVALVVSAAFVWLPIMGLKLGPSDFGERLGLTTGLFGAAVFVAAAIGFLTWPHLDLNRRSLAINMMGLSTLMLTGFARIGFRPGTPDFWISLILQEAAIGIALAAFAAALIYRYVATRRVVGRLEG
jgi:hypothetical protein